MFKICLSVKLNFSTIIDKILFCFNNSVFKKRLWVQALLLILVYLLGHQKSSVIRQKRRSQKRCYKKTKHAEFSEKLTFLMRTCAYQGVKNVCFSENALFSSSTLFEIRLLFYYRQNVHHSINWIQQREQW